MTGVDRRHAERPHPLDEHLARVVGVDGTKLRLHGVGVLELVLIVVAVQRAGDPDRAVRVDEPRRDDGGAQDANARGDRGRRGRADGADAPVGDDDDAVGDRRARHRVHDVAAHGDLGVQGGSDGEGERGRAERDGAKIVGRALHRIFPSS